MSWRSSLLMCPECLGVYYAGMLTGIPDNGTMRFECPNYLCEGNYDLFTIDEQMVEPVKMLNIKGYCTAFCCSGHYRYNGHITQAYIKFKKKYEFKTTPVGWYLDGQCIRSNFPPDMAARMYNLNKWVKELDNLRKGESHGE